MRGKGENWVNGKTGRPENCSAGGGGGGGGGGGMNARRRRGGGLEKWTSVTGPLTRGSFVGLFENLPATMSAVGWHDTPANG